MNSLGASAPTLSILIPTYNWNISELISRLTQQIAAGDFAHAVDIHVFDDASEAHYAAITAEAVITAHRNGTRAALHRSEINVGRSAARNILVERSNGRFLLFLDADVMPDSNGFLAAYIEHARCHKGAVCGGVSYAQCPPPSIESRFYFRYSSRASVAPASVRNKQPWAWLFTANVMVERSIVTAIPFDANFIGYGYEDLEWGVRLAKQGRLFHTDNPVTHLGLLSKHILQRKTRESQPNLFRLTELHPAEASQLNLVKYARRLHSAPTWALLLGARSAGVIFEKLPGPYRIEYLAFQLEKLLLAALVLKSAKRRTTG